MAKKNLNWTHISQLKISNIFRSLNSEATEIEFLSYLYAFEQRSRNVYVKRLIRMALAEKMHNKEFSIESAQLASNVKNLQMG